ncbi:hypothetical protein ABS71_02870 [bacterium SCN 62-11]|nr:MAG: hypothetical protein ABS71_02870 [bacterium SCN 62-11]
MFLWWSLWRIALEPAFVFFGQARYETYRLEPDRRRVLSRTDLRYLPNQSQEGLRWASFGLMLVLVTGSAWRSANHTARSKSVRSGWVDLSACPEKLWQRMVDDPQVAGLRLKVQNLDEATAPSLLLAVCAVPTLYGSLLLLSLAPTWSALWGSRYFLLLSLFSLIWFGLLQLFPAARATELELSFSPPSANLDKKRLPPGRLLLRLRTNQGGKLLLESGGQCWVLRESQQASLLVPWAHALAGRLQFACEQSYGSSRL